MRVASSLFGCGIIAALCGLLAASAVDEKFAPVWPQKGYDATHHARSPHHGPHSSPRLEGRWVSPTGQPFIDFPVINTDGIVIAVDNAGSIFGVNFEPSTPAMRFRVDSGDSGRPRGSPALVGGELIVPLPDATIDVLNSETGVSMGTIKVTDALTGDTGDIVVPSLPGDIEVIVTSVSSSVFMFLWSRGTIPKQFTWEFSDPTGNINGIAIGQAQGKDAIAYAASSDGNIYAIRLLDGKPAWNAPFAIGKDLTEMPAISRDGLYIFINVDGEGTYKINSQTGALVWQRGDIDLFGGASFVIGQNGNLLGGNRLGEFFSFDSKSGDPTWAAPYQAEEAVTSPAVVDGGGYLYFADNGGNVYCLDSVTGTEEWKLSANTTGLAGMAIDTDHALYIVSAEGTFTRIVGEQPPIIIPRTRIPSEAQWAQRGGTPQHSGESRFNGPAVTASSQLGVAWDFKTKGEIVVGAVAAADGTIIIPDDLGNVYGISSSTGSQKWLYHISSGFIAGEPAIDIGSTKVFFGTTTGLLVALNIKDGSQAWPTHPQLPGAILGSVTVTTDSRVYVSCDDSNVYGFDGQEGRQTFKVSTGSLEDDFAPAVLYDDSTILVGSADGFVRAYNSFTQSLRWRYQTHGAVMDVPCIAQTTGDIFVGAANELIAIDGNSGDRLWEQSNVNIAGSSPGCGNKHNLVYVGGTDDTLYAVEEKTGTERWSFATQDAIRSNPVLDEQQETLYVTGMDGYLYALDASTGNLNWKIFVSLFLRGDPVIMSDNSIIVTSEDSDKVYKIAISRAVVPSDSDAGMIVAILLVVGVVGYVGGGIGYSYARTGEVRHVHGKFWSGVGASIGGWCQSTTQGMLRRPVPASYSSASAPIASSSSSAFKTAPASSSGFPSVGAATSSQPPVGSGGGYGSL